MRLNLLTRKNNFIRAGCPSNAPTCECFYDMALAEKEPGAFFIAVRELFGLEASALAGEYWMQLLQASDEKVDSGEFHWRGLIIMAASRLAKEMSSFANQQLRNEEAVPRLFAEVGKLLP